MDTSRKKEAEFSLAINVLGSPALYRAAMRQSFSKLLS
jgi:hypothetical protein